jgi:hypothetical protein
MVEDSQVKRCEYRPEGDSQPLCGRPAVNSGQVMLDGAGPPMLLSMDLCQEHLDERQRRAAGTDPG